MAGPLMWTWVFKLGPFVVAVGVARIGKVNAVVEAKVGDRSFRWPESASTS